MAGCRGAVDAGPKQNDQPCRTESTRQRRPAWGIGLGELSPDPGGARGGRTRVLWCESWPSVAHSHRVLVGGVDLYPLEDEALRGAAHVALSPNRHDPYLLPRPAAVLVLELQPGVAEL